MITVGDGSGQKNKVWAFVFHRLPSYPTSVLTESVKKRFVSNESFVPVLINLLQRERPFFVKLILKHLEDTYGEHSIKLDRGNFSLFFNDLLEVIFTKFTERKIAYLKFFYRRQISLFENAYRLLSNRYTLKKDPELEYLHSGFIHYYLAHLRLPPDIILSSGQSTWFEIYVYVNASSYKFQETPTELPSDESSSPATSSDELSSTELQSDESPCPESPLYESSSLESPSPKSPSKGIVKKLEVHSDLPLFNQQTLSCMALSMNFNDCFCCFRENEICYTSFQAFVNARKKDPNDVSVASLKFNIADLEVVVNLAFLISSHANGIGGATFSEWFLYFIQQLNRFSTNAWESPAPIDVSDFVFKAAEVPYMSFNASDWDPDLKK